MILRYTLLEPGSARFVIGCDEKQFAAVLSYEHDSLRDLLAGTLAILDGSSQIGVLVPEYEGERYLNIRRLYGGRVKLQVVWYSEGKTEVRLTCPSTIWELHRQVLASCEAIVETSGADGYRRHWNGREFPLDLVERLRAAELHVRYEHGELALACCGQHIRIKAFSMRELVAATSAVAAGSREKRVGFNDDERNYLDLVLRRSDDDRAALEVLWSSKYRDTEFPTTVFECETSLERLHGQILAASGD